MFLEKGRDAEVVITVHVREEKQKVVEALISQIVKQMKKKPIILFVAKDEESVVEQIKAGVTKNSNIRFHQLKTDEDALFVSKVVGNAIRGVYFLKECYARGFDLKMACDAICMIYAGDFHYRDLATSIVEVSSVDHADSVASHLEVETTRVAFFEEEHSSYRVCH